MRPLKVIIVDDDRDFAEGIALTLEMEGHEVAFARSGEEAVRKISDQSFDVTLMDVRMPGMNGYESLKEIRKLRPDARIIMMTAFSVEDLLRQAMAEGALGVLHKPIDSASLLNALNEARPTGIILVADDDPDFAQATESTLVGAGYAVRIARSGREAVDLAMDQQFDVMLLDLRMPVLGGLEVYSELKRQGRSLPTIVMTGYEAEESEAIRQLKDLSAKTCLVKPFGASDLLQAIEDMV